MKKILFATLLLPTLLFSQTEKISVDLRGRDCNGGTGICSAGDSRKMGNALNASFTKVSENRLKMIIENKDMSVTDQQRIAGKTFSEIKKEEQTYFWQENDFVIDDNLLKKLNMNSNYQYIKAGKYPIIFENDKSIVVFTLTK